MSSFKIRKVQAKDYDQWFKLWDFYSSYDGRNNDFKLPINITETTWKRFLDPQEPIKALIAESKGSVIGFAHYVYRRDTTSINDLCYLRDLYVQESFQRQGIGRALVDAVTEEAKKFGCDRVYWLTHETNTAAIKLYDKIAHRTGFIMYDKSTNDLPTRSSG